MINNNNIENNNIKKNRNVGNNDIDNKIIDNKKPADARSINTVINETQLFKNVENLLLKKQAEEKGRWVNMQEGLSTLLSELPKMFMLMNLSVPIFVAMFVAQNYKIINVQFVVTGVTLQMVPSADLPNSMIIMWQLGAFIFVLIFGYFVIALIFRDLKTKRIVTSVWDTIMFSSFTQGLIRLWGDLAVGTKPVSWHAGLKVVRALPDDYAIATVNVAVDQFFHKTHVRDNDKLTNLFIDWLEPNYTNLVNMVKQNGTVAGRKLVEKELETKLTEIKNSNQFPFPEETNNFIAVIESAINMFNATMEYSSEDFIISNLNIFMLFADGNFISGC